MPDKEFSQLWIKKAKVSFEFFPPHSAKMEERLWQAVRHLAPLAPSFVSVTYGAGGSTRTRTHALVERILKETSLTPAAHLTCIAAHKKDINAIAHRYWQAGVRHIVALRGDMPHDMNMKESIAPQHSYHYASDLVAGLKKIHDFEITVAAYPEKHPEAASLEADLDNLKRKCDAGATRAISQFFFDPEVYLRFRDEVAKRAIKLELVPGILPVTNVAKVLQFAQKCGTRTPPWLTHLFEGLDNDENTRRLVAAFLAAKQCELLCKEDVHQFHFYTLNRAELTFAICHLLGLRPHQGDAS